MTTQQVAAPKVRAGTLSAYLTSSDHARVLDVRSRVGAVTLSGESGLRALQSLARTEDISGFDLDPAQYLVNPTKQATEQQELFPIDWEAEQESLGLLIVRSAGLAVRKDNSEQLRLAMRTRLRPGARRVVSLHSSWLLGAALLEASAAVRNNDDPFSFVFADLFDPFSRAGAIDGMQTLLEAASASQRPVELLRADTQAIPFVLHGGARGAIGLTSQGRHHPLPFSSKMKKSYDERQRSAWVWLADLLSWQRGIYLGAIEPFPEIEIADCPCVPCDGERLTQYAREWPGQVPVHIRERLQDHDADRWMALFSRLRASSDPLGAWKASCSRAVRMESELLDQYKVAALKVPPSITQWATKTS